MPRTIVITGCSTGIGQEAALHLARSGHQVFASCRNPGGAEELNQRIADENLDLPVLALDLLDQDSIDQCINTVVEQAGRLDASQSAGPFIFWLAAARNKKNARLVRAGRLET